MPRALVVALLLALLSAAGPAGAQRTPDPVRSDDGDGHWAFRAPQRPAAPTVADAEWPAGDIDRFVLEELEARGIRPVGDAPPATLVRRVSFDLTGLPPAPADVEEFVADPSEEAYGRIVDRLLSSPAFGEKWARHWLDVARYAESTGKTVNFTYPQAWRYRDWVIDAFNDDKPYDDFLREQIAGDLLPADDPRTTAARLVATGFLAIGPKTLNERDGLRFELDVADEQLDVTTRAFLGITVACARCHDHETDPIPQADYYALLGIFRSTETCYGTVPFINAQRPSPLLPLPREAEAASPLAVLSEAERTRLLDRIDAVRRTAMEMEDGVQRFFAAGQVTLLRARIDAYETDGTPKRLAMGVRDKPAGPAAADRRGRSPGPGGFTYDGTAAIADSPAFARGEPDRPGEAAIPRGIPAVFGPPDLAIGPGSSGRRELAEWIADRGNPLTARVMVNRVWLHLFGRGLVPTADDFGRGGQPPTHPRLLDHLAHRFMDGGWSVKALIREIVSSRVYRLDSVTSPEAAAIDPDAVSLWRTTPRRLEAESLRDAILAVSGRLDPVPPVGSVVAHVGEGPVTQQRRGGNLIAAALDDPAEVHRSIYLPIIRDTPQDALSLFDAADPSIITTDRPRTTVAPQGLFIMNSDFAMRAADAAAIRLLGDVDDADRIETAFLRFFGRPATSKERVAAGRFVEAYPAHVDGCDESVDWFEREAWSALCQAWFASAEFQFRR